MEAARTARRIDLQAFEAGLRGRLIRPFDPDYDEARLVQSTRFDRFPAAIVQVADATDVARAVGFAREWGFPIAVRGGGHSAAGFGTADGALVIDTSNLAAIHLDPDRRLAWAGAGLRAGQLAEAAAQQGLAAALGDTATVGIAGLTLGGGFGYLSRAYGMTIDSLVAAELVTADGRLVTASVDEHPELFWALRGGGGNFGIVTRLRYRLHDLPEMAGGLVVLPATPTVLRGLAAVAAAAEDELTLIAMVMAAPAAPFIPAEHVGERVVVVQVGYAGSLGAAERALAPLRTLATPLSWSVRTMPVPGFFDLTRGGERRGASVLRAGFLAALDDAAIGDLLDGLDRASTPRAMVQLRFLGGAIGRVAPDATAFAHRHAGVLLSLIVPYADLAETERHTRRTEAIFARFRARSMGAYVNFLADECDTRIHEAYPGTTYQRLAAVKRAWDPSNVFRANQNVRPAGAAR